MATTLKINPQMIYRKIGEQRIVVPVGQQIDSVRCIFTLNETAAFVLDGFVENLNETQITEKLLQEYEEVNEIEARKAVDEIVTELRQQQILL